MTTETAIATMVDRIVGRFHPSRVVLFGSQARGTANEWSDVDLLVVMGDAPDKRRAAVEMRRLLGDMPVSKDIVVTTPDEIARRVTWLAPFFMRRFEKERSSMNDPDSAAVVLQRGHRSLRLLTELPSAPRHACCSPTSRREGVEGGLGTATEFFTHDLEPCATIAPVRTTHAW